MVLSIIGCFLDASGFERFFYSICCQPSVAHNPKKVSFHLSVESFVDQITKSIESFKTKCITVN